MDVRRTGNIEVRWVSEGLCSLAVNLLVTLKLWRSVSRAPGRKKELGEPSSLASRSIIRTSSNFEVKQFRREVVSLHKQGWK